MIFDYCLKFNQVPQTISQLLFEQLIDAPWLHNLCEQIAAGDKDKKRELPAIMWQATFDGKKRSNQNARSSGLYQLDVDHCNPDEVWERIASRVDELGIYAAHKTASREGIRIVAKCRPEFKTLLDNQLWLSEQIQVQPDTACKDFARLGFVCERSYFYHYNPAIFTDEPEVLLENQGTGFQPEGEGGTSSYPQANSSSMPTVTQSMGFQPSQGSQTSLDGSTMSNPVRSAGISNPNTSTCQEGSTSYPQDYDGIPYTLLVDCLADQLGGVPVHGSRNNFLFSMACHLRYVCNDDPQWIRKVLPTYGEDSERVFRTIQSACNRAQSRNVPAMLQRAISVARGQQQYQSAKDSGSNPLNGSTPPEMPKKLPKLIQHLVSKVDPMYRPAVAQAVFAPLGAHLHGVQTRYIDNSINDLGGFMSVLMAKQSIGKGSVNMPINMIMTDILDRDSYSREQEKAWKALVKAAKANEKKPSRPEGLCVQNLMSNMTNAALVQRLLDAEAAGGKFLYVRLDEIELLDQIKATGGATASEIIRLAFTQSLYGQERVGNDSITGTPPLRFNFNASTTVPAGQAYFRGGLTNGTLSRLTFSTIIKPIGKRGIPRFGDYDEDFKRILQPYIVNLNAATGLIECRQAERMAEQLCEENEDLAELSDDDVFETWSYRANRIAYDKAMLLFIAQGYQWTKDIADFCRWSEQYDLWCKLHFFGQQTREQNQVESLPTSSGPQNMLDLLPDRFSKQDLAAIHRAQGRDGNVMQLIYTWCNRGHISLDETTQEYVKSKAYLAKHKSVLS